LQKFIKEHTIKIELNIRLDIIGRRNSVADCTKRARLAIDHLEKHFGPIVARRHDVEIENEQWDSIDLHQNLIVGLNPGADFASMFRNIAAIEELAVLLEQDCIAVYNPSCNRGSLIGPRPDKWGWFSKEKFVRFAEMC